MALRPTFTPSSLVALFRGALRFSRSRTGREEVFEAAWSLRGSELRWTLVGLQTICSVLIVAGSRDATKPDMRVAHFAGRSAVAAMLLQALDAVPYVVVCHAYDVFSTHGDTSWHRRIEAASAVLSITPEVDQIVETRAGISPERHVMEVSQSVLQTELTLPKDRVVEVCAVAGLEQKKGLDVLIKAAGIARQAGEEWKVVIGGYGDLQGDLERLASELDVSVEFPGLLNETEVATLMNSAQVFCLPCRTDDQGNRDGLPVAIMEAIACGCKIVTTPLSGFVDGQYAAVKQVEPEDADAIYATVSQLLAEPPSQIDLANSRDLLLERHGPGSGSRTIERVLCDVIKEKAHG